MTLRIGLPAVSEPVPRDYGTTLSAADREAILRPGRVGSMEVRCRVMLPAMESNLGTRDGRVSEQLIAYYRARAAGGVGWVTTENTSVHPTGRVAAGMLRIETDAEGALFAPLADAVHAEGAGFLVQLSHAGRQTLSDFAGEAPWAPSAVACPVMKDEPRAMTDADVHTLIGAFVDGARRARRAGADGVELHMAHGYLLGGFLSSDQNRRDDAWGGDTARRCAFPTAVVRGIKQACGGDFVVIARFSADEYVQGGTTVDEALLIARRLVDAGADALHVSACNYESMFWNIPTYFLPEAPFVSLAAQVRAAVDVPVIAVGRIHRPEVAARVLRSGQADFVAMGRPQIADPDLVNKIRQDRLDTIRPCLACNRCIASINGAKLECSVNPHLGFEGVPWKPGTGRVVVVGAGVAGLASAWFAAEAGWTVRLIERRSELGGQLDIASFPPTKEPVGWYLRWLVDAVRAHPSIEVQSGREANADDLAGADRVVWAGGSAPRRFAIPGVPDSLPQLALDEAMRDPALAGDHPLVLGAGAGGSEGAHWLAHQGAQVELVEQKRKIAMNLIPPLRFHLERELEHEGVTIHTQARDLRFEDHTARYDKRKVGTVELPGITALVHAAGRAALPLPEVLAGRDVIAVGDAAEPASIFEALIAAAKVWR